MLLLLLLPLPRYTRPHVLPIWPGYPFGDISYWVGLVFTLGCVAWVVNGHYALHATGLSTSEEGATSVAAVAALVGGGCADRRARCLPGSC